MGDRVVVIALGGNAILPARGAVTVARQLRTIDIVARQIARIIKQNYKVVITHGNGPQVGNLLLQQEHGQQQTQSQPLDICGAMTQGQIGYMLQNRLANQLARMFAKPMPVCTLMTQVETDMHTAAAARPCKPVGPFHTAAEARHLERTRGYVMRNVAPHEEHGWRRVVASPAPRCIVEAEPILRLLEHHVVVIACGGGGIPVVRAADGSLHGVEAVVDKDLTACLLAQLVAATCLLILTDVEGAALQWGTPRARMLSRLTVTQALRHHRAGEFPEGSMGPKIKAAAHFAKHSGQPAVIASLRKAYAALSGKAGTRVVPDRPQRACRSLTFSRAPRRHDATRRPRKESATTRA